MKQFWLAVDIDRCVGCHTCEVACKQENELPEGTNWIRVLKVGPAIVRGNLVMDFVPIVTDECTVCQKRLDEGLEPYCVSVCPTDAFKFLEVSCMLEELKSRKRIQILKSIEKEEKLRTQ